MRILLVVLHAMAQDSAKTVLGDDLYAALTAQATHRELEASLQLIDQAWRGIDYARLGQGWTHPRSRVEYRSTQHPSIEQSRGRQAASANHLKKRLDAALRESGSLSDAICAGFNHEIGVDLPCNFDAVAAALDAELLMPLRALNEAQSSMVTTFYGDHVPPHLVAAAVNDLTTAVLSGSFDTWRYENPVGRRQLEGLSHEQVSSWRDPLRVEHPDAIITREDAPGELGFFWATKIGGPSHGFDYEGQCLLPLLCNARSKVILVDDLREWPYHPAGRAHFKLLWRRRGHNEEPLLWLETVNVDFSAAPRLGEGRSASWQRPVLLHAVHKARAMVVPLSVAPELYEALVDVTDNIGVHVKKEEDVILRASNGVVEASDYLSDRHDWVQTGDEVVRVGARAIWTPPVQKKVQGWVVT